MARERCNPYDAVNRFKLYCKNAGVAKIALTFDHSINGSAFYRIVDEPNLCQLKYHPFSHNTWIKTEYDAPKLIGYPVKNFYSGYASIENKPILKDSLIILP
jgi:hypothetical protein